MTDDEFEALNAELLAWLQKPGSRRTRRIDELLRRRDSCRDCDRPDPEFYMVANELWASVGLKPNGGGQLCLDCP
jgi:hypothetical protein